MVASGTTGLWAKRVDAQTRVPRAAAPTVAPRWFAALYALAVAAHVVGNPPAAIDLRGLATVLLAGAAGVLARGTAGRRLWGLVAVSQLLTAWLQAPVIGNHWVVMSIFSLAVLASLPRDDPWAWLAPTVRLTFLCFYAFAAFAKLNTAFLDPSASCGVFYADQALRSWGLPGLAPDAAFAAAAVWAPLLIELSVPVLLVLRRTRAAGVAVAAVFHYVISLDLLQHFYDFTAVVFVGLAVFAAPAVMDRLDQWLQRRSRGAVVVVALWAVLAVAAIAPPTLVTVIITRLGAFVVWIPVGAAVALLLARGVASPAAVRLRPPGAVAVGLIALVVCNGVAPYVGVKTASGFTMYSNLATAEGRANHLLVGHAPSLRAVDYVRVTATDLTTLRGYVGSRWLVPEPNLRDHLATYPAATVTFVRGDGTVVAGTGAQLGRPLPEVVRRVAPLRSVDALAPAACQALWLPAL